MSNLIELFYAKDVLFYSPFEDLYYISGDTLLVVKQSV